MTVLHTAQQSDGKAWRDGRVGRFTSSEIGALFQEPRSLSHKHVIEYSHLLPEIGVSDRKFKTELRKRIEDAGITLFGQGAMKLIASKAGERKTNKEDHYTNTRSMDRGSILEHVAKFLLSRHWKKIDDAKFQAWKDYAGCTPDGFLAANKEPWDAKCPESFADIILFEQDVRDDDHAAMEDWDSDHYWQIMTQARFSGANAANLTLFTDRLNIYKFEGARFLEDGFTINPDSEENIVHHIVNMACEHLSEDRPWPASYQYASDGWYAVHRHFTLTPEIIERIDRTVLSADQECNRMLATTMRSPTDGPH